jgi:hypothetical protein
LSYVDDDDGHQQFKFLSSLLGQLELNFAGMMFDRSSTEVAHYADPAMSERLHSSIYKLYIYYNSKQQLDSLSWVFT